MRRCSSYPGIPLVSLWGFLLLTQKASWDVGSLNNYGSAWVGLLLFEALFNGVWGKQYSTNKQYCAGIFPPKHCPAAVADSFFIGQWFLISRLYVTENLLWPWWIIPSILYHLERTKVCKKKSLLMAALSSPSYGPKFALKSWPFLAIIKVCLTLIEVLTPSPKTCQQTLRPRVPPQLTLKRLLVNEKSGGPFFLLFLPSNIWPHFVGLTTSFKWA